jgi:predicted nicotinamide N-methyase
MHIPENRVRDVQNLLEGGGLESVTETHEIVIESVESVTESKAEPTRDIRRIIERWGERLVPHQDASGQVKQPWWSKCWEMWQELARVIQQGHQG